MGNVLHNLRKVKLYGIAKDLWIRLKAELCSAVGVLCLFGYISFEDAFVEEELVLETITKGLNAKVFAGGTG